MFSRRSFIGGSSTLLAAAATRSTLAAVNPEPALDLDFRDRDAQDRHTQAFGATLRYVDHEVFGDAAGVIVEEASLNGVEDAGYSEAGSLPTGWRIVTRSGTASGVQCTFTKIDAACGRINVRGKSAEEITIIMGSDRYFPIKQGELLTGSIALRLAPGGSNGPVSPGMFIVERNVDGSVPESNPITASIQQIQSDKAWWAQVQHVARGDGFATLAFRITTKTEFDLSFELNYPQLEKRAWRSSFCQSSRQSDETALATASNYLSAPERSVLITADAPRFVSEATLWNEYADAYNLVEVILRDKVIYARVTAGGSATELRLGVVPPLMRFTVCLILKAKGFAASLNGKPLQSLECRMPGGLRQARLGSGSMGSWNSTVVQLKLFRAAIVDGAAASRPQEAMYDDFDRPNSSSLGVSPTGQSIQRFGSASKIVDRRWVAEDELGLTFAAYGTVRLRHVPRYIGTVLRWTTGMTEGGAGLIAATHDNLDQPLDALHTVVTDQREIFQTISHSRVDNALANFTYTTPMHRDATTVYGIAVMLNASESAVVYVGPQGDLVRHVDPTYAQRAGSVAVFEHYWGLGHSRPEFLAIAAF